jgi:hypothetical protein
MSLDKAIKHGKEKRKPYRKSKRFDRSCRCHGGCPYCESDRLKQDRRDRKAAEEQVEEESYEEPLD